MEKAKYIELYKKLVSDINQGILKAGDKLPSKRTLAIELGLSVNTVMNAYMLLLDEGYIYSVEKKGYFIEHQPEHIHKEDNKSYVKDIPEEILYDFTTQNIDSFSSTNWKSVMRDVWKEEQYLNKTPSLGSLELRQAISNHLREQRGIQANVETIVIGSGMEMLEHILLSTAIGSVTLENPGYHKLAKIAETIGFSIHYVPLDEFGCTLPVERTILYTTPVNQFPTGVKMTISRKKELIQFARETNSYIIEDDFDAEFRINQTPTAALKTMDPEHVIFFSTFTETIYPGLRISYAVLPKELLQSYKKKYKFYSQNVPTLEQLTLARFINDGYYITSINRTKRMYLKKRSYILELLKNHPLIQVDEKKNYLSLLLYLNTSIEDKKIKNLMKSEKIAISLLSDFDVENNHPHTLILGYTAIAYASIEPAIEALLDALKKLGI